jgi:Flp pilus assembly pilin Flp
MMRFRRDEEGQALVEFTLVAAFVLLPLLGGVVYLGGMVITQQHLTTAARHVARRAALDSQEKAFGQKATQSAASAGIRDTALGETGQKSASVKGVNWTALGAESGRPGSLKAIDNYTAELEWTAPITVSTEGGGKASSYTMGVGVLYHGATLERSYSELAPIGNLAGLFTPSVSATSVSATELAPRGDRRVKGLLDLNSWIGGIVNEPAPNLP